MLGVAAVGLPWACCLFERHPLPGWASVGGCPERRLPPALCPPPPQFEIAMEFQPQFSDREWVATTKRWPPRLMAALERFLTLS